MTFKLEPNIEIVGVEIAGENLEGGDAHFSRFIGCRFSGVNFSNANFEGANFSRCVFEHCIFNKALFDYVNAYDTRFTSCQFTDMQIRNVYGSHVTLAMCVFNRVRFSDFYLGGLYASTYKDVQLDWNCVYLIADILRRHADLEDYQHYAMLGLIEAVNWQCWADWLFYGGLEGFENSLQWAMEILCTHYMPKGTMIPAALGMFFEEHFDALPDGVSYLTTDDNELNYDPYE